MSYMQVNTSTATFLLCGTLRQVETHLLAQCGVTYEVHVAL
jgi:hypothetical protein